MKGVGILLTAQHRDDVLADPGGIDWLELGPEELLETRGRGFRPKIPATVERLASRLPVTLHGTELSIGSVDPFDTRYLDALKELIRIFRPGLVSDHVCFTGALGRRFRELMPLPFEESVAAYLVDRIRFVQDYLGVRMAFENPPGYVTYARSEMSEPEFLTRIAEGADCLLLLDVSNLHVSATNNGFDAERFLDALPARRVAQVHLAGYHRRGQFLFDTHAAEVSRAVWKLYEHALRRFGPIATNVEWDVDVPSFEHLKGEVAKARRVRETVFGDR